MNRALTVIFSALEALLVVGIGVGISLVPLSLLWAFEFGLQVDWVVFWRVAADAWLVGHGVDVHVSLVPGAMEPFGLVSASAFDISIAALGFGMLTLLLAVRAGRRIGVSEFWRLGLLAATAIFAVLALSVVVSATHPAAVPDLVQGVTFPTLVFAGGLIVGVRRPLGRSAANRPGASRTALSDLIQRVPLRARSVTGLAVRGGLAAVAGLMVISALACAVLIGFRYAEIVALYESVHSGVLGGIALTLGQLALAPNLVVWAAAWFVGPGFAVGAGSSVAPLGTSLGTVPAIPILGAVPVEASGWGFVGLLVPVVAAFAAGVVVRPSLSSAWGGREALLVRIATGVGIGLVGGVTLALLAAASAGSAGPGRLALVGPDALAVGLWATLEFSVAATAGVLAGRPARAD